MITIMMKNMIINLRNKRKKIFQEKENRSEAKRPLSIFDYFLDILAIVILILIVYFVSVNENNKMLEARLATINTIEAIPFYIKNYNVVSNAPFTDTIDVPVVNTAKNNKNVDLKELNCIIQALWFEARGEGDRGIKAVLSVIMNRVNSDLYPNTYCQVINQNRQFSYLNNKKNKDIKIVINDFNKKTYEQIVELSKQVLRNEFKPVFSKHILWYTKNNIHNYWTNKKKVAYVIGNHKFFIKG